MKKRLIITLLFCACLTSCAPHHVEPSTDDLPHHDTTSDETTEATPSTDNNTDADTRIAYYEHLVNELQQELLNIKTELYVSRVEYESRISELEEEKSTSEPPLQNDSPILEKIDYTYELNNGSLTITSYCGSEKKVIIPASIDGYPVTAIGDHAFEKNASITSVTLPHGITSIGWFAFSGCVSLSNISIPGSVQSIGYGAFQNCNANLTIKCLSDSYARQYANSYGFLTSS